MDFLFVKKDFRYIFIEQIQTAKFHTLTIILHHQGDWLLRIRRFI